MKYLLILAFFGLFIACSTSMSPDKSQPAKAVSLDMPTGKQATAAFAEGCFWCVEEVFEAVVGVDSAVSGYAGGHVPNPTYELVNTETTGHAEAVLVYYRPDVISYEELCRVFYHSHDATTFERQGPDRGNSYRSILFYQNDAEKAIAENVTKESASLFSNPIVTERKSLDNFWRAEQYHQDYIIHNPDNPYVKSVSLPRFERFKASYKGKLKH